MPRAGRVLLVGFQDQDNLGLGYLASSLRAAGHDVRIESFGAIPTRSSRSPAGGSRTSSASR